MRLSGEERVMRMVTGSQARCSVRTDTHSAACALIVVDIGFASVYPSALLVPARNKQTHPYGQAKDLDRRHHYLSML